MAGFILGNTLSENGGVTRGICQVDDRELLTSIVETHDITKTADGAGVPDGNGGFAPLDTNSHVSMNMWGFTPEILRLSGSGFRSIPFCPERRRSQMRIFDPDRCR